MPDILPKDGCYKHLHEFHVRWNSCSLNLDPEVFPFPVLQLVNLQWSLFKSQHRVHSAHSIHCTVLQHTEQYLLGNLSSWPPARPPGIRVGESGLQPSAKPFRTTIEFQARMLFRDIHCKFRIKTCYIDISGKVANGSCRCHLSCSASRRGVSNSQMVTYIVSHLAWANAWWVRAGEP